MEVHAHSHTERKKWTHYLWEFLNSPAIKETIR
jgi:hypothetical protein